MEGKQTKPRLLSCEACEGPVSSAAKACPKCGHPVQVCGTCEVCGQPVPSGAGACPTCGHPQNVENTNGPNQAVVSQVTPAPTNVPIAPIASIPTPASPPVISSTTATLAATVSQTQETKPATMGQPHIGRIVIMWIAITLVAIFEVSTGLSAGFLLNVIPIGIAIFLVLQKSTTDKINGWIVIGLASLGLLITLAGAF